MIAPALATWSGTMNMPSGGCGGGACGGEIKVRGYQSAEGGQTEGGGVLFVLHHDSNLDWCPWNDSMLSMRILMILAGSPMLAGA